MDFSNASVTVGDLPASDKIILQPVQKDYLKVLRIEWAITSALLFIIGLALFLFVPALGFSLKGVLMLFAVFALAAFYYLVQEKAFPYMAYGVREKDIIYQKGWIMRTIKTCPFNRIQNCSLSGGPLERKFGLASLSIYTAGSEGADLRIPGLRQEEAESLRHFILAKIHAENENF